MHSQFIVQKFIFLFFCEIAEIQHPTVFIYYTSNPQLSLSTFFPACTRPLITEFDDLNR